VRCLDALLTALERDRASPLVALGEAAMEERHRQLVLPCSRLEAELPQPSVDLFDRGIQLLIDRLVIDVTANRRAIELLAVEQDDDRVLELHPRHFARQRHVTDRELVFAVCREIVFDDEAAARAEGHAFEVMLLPAGAGSAVRRQRNNHVGDVAVRRRLGQSFGVTDSFERDRARGVDVLVDEVGRDLKGGGVVVEVAFDVVFRQPGGRVDVEPEQIAYGVCVLPAIEPAQRHTSGPALRGAAVDSRLEPRDEFSRGASIRALGASRRHETTAQLADHFLTDLGALVRVVQVQCRQRQAARLQPVVVTADAVLIDQSRLRRGFGAQGSLRSVCLRCDGARGRLWCLRLGPQSVCEHKAEQHGARSDCVPGNSLRHRYLLGRRPAHIRRVYSWTRSHTRLTQDRT
jgi:hypothetical protein